VLANWYDALFFPFAEAFESAFNDLFSASPASMSTIEQYISHARMLGLDKPVVVSLTQVDNDPASGAMI
jgi:hypothetical protein